MEIINMKRIISSIIIAAAAILSFSSCHKDDWKQGADLKTLTISYDLAGNSLDAFPATGSTITKAVVVSQGAINRDIDWTVSVDNAPDWVSVEKTTMTTHFTGTYDGDDRDVEHKAVTITVKANATGAKRTAVIRFTVADGSSISTILTQNK